MNEIQIFENWLPQPYFDEIKYKVINPEFNWNFNDISVYPSEKEINDPSEYQFNHVIYANSKPICMETYNLFSQFIRSLGANILLKLKLNLNPYTSTIREKAFHTDIPILTTKNIKYNTGILYLNTNNGFTKFKSGETISSIENRFIVFDGDVPHCGSSCTDKKSRIVLNVNWI